MDPMHYCANCGAPHPAEARFCENCGAAITATATPVAPAPPAPPAAVGPAPEAPPSPRNRTILWLAVGGLGVLFVAVAAALVLTRGDGGGGGGNSEIFLEPVAYATPDSFTANVDVHNAAQAGSTTATTAPIIPTTAPADPSANAAVRSVSGAWPGLYGGTRDRATCDKDKLVSFLKANPDKARAWAGVVGVQPSQIEGYVDTLTPIILQRDTRVTNHGFRNGRATPIQSVLQAGTAVMVDAYGVPRVKCNCGNPLAEPQALSRAPRYTGERWPTFSPANVIRVTTDVKVSVFILVDVQGGDPISRPPGTSGEDDTAVVPDSLCDLYPEDTSCKPPATTTTTVAGEPTLGTGDVQVTLRWSSKADLDLAVNDPGGGQIDYQNRTSASGGTLDVDSNHDCATASGSGVENVYWPTGKAPEGVYRLTVTYYDVCGGSPLTQPFQLTFKANGVDAAITPASLHRTDDGVTATYEVQVAPGRSSLLGNAGGTRIQTQSGTVEAGKSTSYTAEKGPGYQAPEPTPAEPTPGEPAPEPGSTTTPERQKTCEELYPGPADATNPMRVLCEHDPT